MGKAVLPCPCSIMAGLMQQQHVPTACSSLGTLPAPSRRACPAKVGREARKTPIHWLAPGMSLRWARGTERACAACTSMGGNSA